MAASASDPTESANEISALAVGSLCVATVFETDLIAQLASRPAGVRLLVIGPDGYRAPTLAFGERAPDMVMTASSVGELATAIQQLTPPTWTTPPIAATDVDTVSSEKSAPSTKRGWLVTAGAMVGALAIGGIVIASTEGSSAASANTGIGRGGFSGGGFPGGGAQGGTGTRGGAGIPGVTGANEQQLLACIHKQGFSGSIAQLFQNGNDPKLQAAFMTCVQQLQGGGPTTSSHITGRP